MFCLLVVMINWSTASVPLSPLNLGHLVFCTRISKRILKSIGSQCQEYKIGVMWFSNLGVVLSCQSDYLCKFCSSSQVIWWQKVVQMKQMYLKKTIAIVIMGMLVSPGEMWPGWRRTFGRFPLRVAEPRDVFYLIYFCLYCFHSFPTVLRLGYRVLCIHLNVTDIIFRLQSLLFYGRCSIQKQMFPHPESALLSLLLSQCFKEQVSTTPRGPVIECSEGRTERQSLIKNATKVYILLRITC